MITQIIENEIFYKGEKVATLIDDPRKSTITDEFCREIACDRRWY